MNKAVTVEIRMTVPEELTAEAVVEVAKKLLAGEAVEGVKLNKVRVFYSGHFKGKILGESQ